MSTTTVAPKTGKYSLVEFGEGSDVPLDALTALHEALLSKSPIVLLGRSFIRDFYYAALAEEGLLFGTVAYVGSEPAGFIVATEDSAGFLREGIRSQWRQLIFTVMRSIVSSPSRIASVIEALHIMRNRPEEPSASATSELLSFGVLPEFLNCRDESGHRLPIGRDLLDSAMNRLNQRGATRTIAIIDADNFAAQLFFKSEGWTLARTEVPGWRVPSVEFVWDEDRD